MQSILEHTYGKRPRRTYVQLMRKALKVAPYTRARKHIQRLKTSDVFFALDFEKYIDLTGEHDWKWEKIPR